MLISTSSTLDEWTERQEVLRGSRRAIASSAIGVAVRSGASKPRISSVCELVRDGKVELGIVVITQTLTTPGVELVGPLPSEMQLRISFEGGIAATSKAPDAGKQLFDFLRSPEVSEVIKAQGMAPAD